MVFLFGITASTFAWFKINSNASVSGFEFTVQGGEGYQISLDNEHYYNSLTSRQMVMAILKGYNSAYAINANDIYSNPIYDDQGNITDYGTPMTNTEISNEFAHILMMPLSPINVDGKLVFRNYIKNVVSPSSGQYIEFSIYFKALGKEEDKQSYSIYVLGENLENDITGEMCYATSIKSAPDEIELNAAMTAIDNSNPDLDFGARSTVTYPNSSKVKVYTSNAIRFSIGNENDENFKENDDYVCKNQIYEISDDVAYNLGSYATNYDEYYNNLGIDTDSLEHNLYDCNSNAQYTYYNNLRPFSLQSPMNYDEMPNTIKHLVTVRENEDENSSYYNKINYITTVNSGEKPHKLTFRFWLEGYDADCFDNINKSIRVNLSFGSVKNKSTN